MKEFLKKIKTDKKIRNTVICAGIGAVIVIAAAVVIPVGVHSSNMQKALAAEEAAQAALAAETSTEEAAEKISAEATTEPTTAETAIQAANGGADANKGTASNTGKSGSSGNNGGSGSSGSGASSQKPNSGNSNNGSSNDGQPKQETPAVEQPDKKNPELDWTQADVDAVVAEAKQYARNRGLVIDSSLTEKGTSWSSPIDTRLDYKSNAAGDLHYKIENSLRGISEELIESGVVTINIFSVNCGSYWEIYVVY